MQENKTILSSIRSPEDLKRLYKNNPNAIQALAAEIRTLLIDSVSKNGGHLASNLGVVELTIAIHLVFRSPEDSIIYDVGHQSYVHKILTGRAEGMNFLRKKDGLSGFPKTSESPHDMFNTGHASTSISAALGLLRAKKLRDDDSHVVALIGDAALTGGMAFEALNDAGQSELPLIIVLNDNTMAIAKTVGALGTHLSKLRASNRYRKLKQKTRTFLEKKPRYGAPLSKWLERTKNRIKYFLLPNVFFEPMGVTYIGPIDGHNVQDICSALDTAKRLNRPVVVHAVTKKGKGYKHAENDPTKFHGIGKFNADNGLDASLSRGSNSYIFGDTLAELAETNKAITAITAAMPDSTGLAPFSTKFPERFFDVGIAEQHAVTLAAGMCMGGLRPVVAVYSTFFQRAYDQILHDVCLQNLPVVFCIDRAGLVGEDGETHQGVYDIAYFMTMPNMLIMSPASREELKAMIAFAFEQNQPAAIRYSRGLLPSIPMRTPLEYGRWEMLSAPSRVTVIATGRLLAQTVRASAGLDVGIINARFLKPLDTKLLDDAASISDVIITIEDGIKANGFGSAVAAYIASRAPHVRVETLGVPDTPIEQASIAQQDDLCGISPVKIRETLMRALEQSEGR